MNERDVTSPQREKVSAPRRPYVRPQVKRVVLAMEETLATNCKDWNSNSACQPSGIQAYTTGS